MIGAMSISQLVGCEPKASRGAVLIGLQLHGPFPLSAVK